MNNTYERIHWLAQNVGDVVPIHNDWWQYFNFRTHNYLWIDKCRAKYEVTAAMHKTTAPSGNAFCASFNEKGFTGEAYFTHLSMWPARTEEQAQYIAGKVAVLIDRAFESLYKE